MERPLTGSIAIVTGASRGLGRAFALNLAESGAALTVVARSDVDLTETANQARAYGAACEMIVGMKARADWRGP